MASETPLLHILVVGFHHKKGCQVEFSYPELRPSWKYLPTLAIPDGSHHYGQDTVYFNLPSSTNSAETIFGVACYRQIPVEKLKNRTSDVTRSTVQKSVIALCSVPIYGYVEVKLSLIADCFFNQGDFERTEILINAYAQLNACLLDNNSPYDRVPGLSPVRSLQELSLGGSSGNGNMFHIGLPLRDLILRWRQKILVLFKLLLLQRRIVCFGSPVRPMCDLILSIASLHPQLLESGFREVACVKTSRPMSPMPDFNEHIKVGDGDEEKEIEKSNQGGDDGDVDEGSVNSTPASEEGDHNHHHQVNHSRVNDPQKQLARGLSRDTSVDAFAASLTPLCAVPASDWGAPLPIFSGGCLCLPYISLPYMDLLTDPSVVGYCIGTSNILFQQKRNLADILVDVESMQLDIVDVELRRQIQLSTEDLRFFDFLLRHVQSPRENAEGSDRWIRDQFQAYVLALLRTTVACVEGSKEVDTFNGCFVNQFKRTNCFVEWVEANVEFSKRLAHIPAGHPFAGNMSVQDVKLKLANSMQSTEGGRKLNQAVNTTSKAVGGALTQAKGAFSNWWSSITTTTEQEQKRDALSEKGDNQSEAESDGMVIVGEEERGSSMRGDGQEVLEGMGMAEELGTPAEEFLESEMQVARKEVPQRQGDDHSHRTGTVFTV